MLNVTVCVVVYNALEHMRECLESLLQQNYSQELYEILVIDNNSTDGTKELLEKYSKSYDNVRLKINPIIGIAGSRNLGLREAKYEYVAFTDSDCLAPRDWLSSLVHGFEVHQHKVKNLVAVGGSNVPPQTGSRFYTALSIFLDTFLGSHGSVQGKRFKEDRLVPHIPTANVMYHKKTVLQASGFDVTLGNIGEDQDLSYRLQHLGYNMVYLANCSVIHKLRPTFKSWLKNMHLYGKGRMWLIRKHPENIELVLLAPMILVLSLVLVPLSFSYPLFLLPVLYFPLLLAISVIECLRAGKPAYTIYLFGLYIGTHIAYGIGEIAGLLKNREFHKAQLFAKHEPA